MAAVTAMQELKNGAFVRSAAGITNWVRADGSTQFKPEAGRYQLYVSYACPWASRCLFARAVKGLQDVIGLTVVHPVFIKTSEDPQDTHRGWWFSEATEEFPECSPDPVFNAKTMRELYSRSGAEVTKYSVPVLLDKQTRTIVSNESSMILRMLSSEFNEFSSNPSLDLYPDHLRAEIEAINHWIYEYINDGVYKSGFATKQEPYEEAVTGLFNHLDKAEDLLGKQRYLTGNDTYTEADARFVMTLWRFDEVYHGHFKCNKKLLGLYPNLTQYCREMYQLPGVSDTVNMKHIKHHYHRSHPSINPHGIVPVGPGVDFSLPHDRDRFASKI